MSVIQFESVVEGNSIRIPDEYAGRIPGLVTVTIGAADNAERVPQPDLLEAIEDVRSRRNLSRPYKTAEEAVAAMLRG